MTDSLGDIAERHEDSTPFNNTLDWPDFTSNPLRGVCARLKDAGWSVTVATKVNRTILQTALPAIKTDKTYNLHINFHIQNS